MKKILISLMIGVLIFSCSDDNSNVNSNIGNGSSNNTGGSNGSNGGSNNENGNTPAPDNPKPVTPKDILAKALDEIIQKPKGSEIVYKTIRQDAELTNPRQEDFVEPLDLDKFIFNSGLFKDKYNTSVRLGLHQDIIPPDTAALVDTYVCKNDNVVKKSPYTFFAFLTQQEIEEFDRLLPEKMETITIEQMQKIVDLIKPHTVAYPYNIKAIENKLEICQ